MPARGSGAVPFEIRRCEARRTAANSARHGEARAPGRQHDQQAPTQAPPPVTTPSALSTDDADEEAATFRDIHTLTPNPPRMRPPRVRALRPVLGHQHRPPLLLLLGTVHDDEPRVGGHACSRGDHADRPQRQDLGNHRSINEAQSFSPFYLFFTSAENFSSRLSSVVLTAS